MRLVQRLAGNAGTGKGSLRRNLFVVTHEGFPAIAIFFLLGGPFQTSYLLHLGATSVQIGIALSIPQLVNVLQITGAFFMQTIENRQRWLLILGGLHRVIWVLTGLIPFVFSDELGVIVYLLVFGFAYSCNALGSVVWTSLVADIVPGPLKGAYFGIRNMILWGVGSLCLFLGGLALDAHPGAAGFHLLFLVSGGLAVWNIVAYMLYPNPRFEKSQEPDKRSMFLKPFRDRTFCKSMMFITLWLFVQGIALPLFNYVMQKILHTSYNWVSAVTIAQNVAMMISYYFWGKLNGKYPSRTLLLWTLPVIAASCLIWGAIGWLPALLVLLVSHVLVGIGTSGFNLLMFNFTIADTPKSDRPMYVGVFSACTGLAGFAGSTFGGYIYEWIAGAPMRVQTSGVFAAVGAVLLFIAATAGPAALKDRQRDRAAKNER